MKLRANIEETTFTLRGLEFVIDAEATGQMIDIGIGSYEFWGGSYHDTNIVFEPDEVELLNIHYCGNDFAPEEFKEKYPNLFGLIDDTVYAEGQFIEQEQEME